MEAIRLYVQGAFANVPATPAALEQQEELISDLRAKMADLVEQGLSEEAALGSAIASLGDLSALVREFESAEETSVTPKAATVDVDAVSLSLHTAVITSGIVLGALLLATLVGLVLDGIRAGHILLNVGTAAAALAWIGAQIARLHAGSHEVRTIGLDVRDRLVRALVGWTAICVVAFMFNMVASGIGFWAWIVWCASAAWPAAILVERGLVRRGLFLAGDVEESGSPTPEASNPQ